MPVFDTYYIWLGGSVLNVTDFFPVFPPRFPPNKLWFACACILHVPGKRNGIQSCYDGREQQRHSQGGPFAV